MDGLGDIGDIGGNCINLEANIMCNMLRPRGKRVYKIPEKGTGYKIFLKRLEKGFLRGPYKPTQYQKNVWITWRKDNPGDGFCFFLSLSEAKKFVKPRTWLRHSRGSIYKIEYMRGLGKRREGRKRLYNDVSYMSSLCKAFKILEEVK